MDGVNNRSDIRDFLATRRAKLTPEQVGLPAGGGRRRVPGLRREEVAVLAGVSIYTAEPGTASEDRLRLLASWAATHVPAQAATDPTR